MTLSDDEYDAHAGGPIVLTEQDIAVIDALSASPTNYLSPVRMSHIDIAVDANKTREQSSPTSFASPMKRYRPDGRLSVSDLVSPAWCELQFEYGLLQRRSWRLHRRPKSFMSRQGKQICVEQKVAQLNDTILQGGKAVHSALEREVHPTKVEVPTVTKEEHWGLRLFNMISDLHTLLLIGKCREFRVMGFIHDHFVTGIIDEISRAPVAQNPVSFVSGGSPGSSVPTSNEPRSKTKLIKDPTSPKKQLSINSFFPEIPRKPVGSSAHADDANGRVSFQEAQGQVEPLHRRTHILRLIDNKTRLSPSLPEHSATLSSRLQLMTYKRLLDALLTTVPPFNFTKLWQHLCLDSERNFSKDFMERVSLLSPTEEHKVKCLKDLEKYWCSLVRKLGASEGEGEQDAKNRAPVDPELTLVYRLRDGGQGRKRKRRDTPSSTPRILSPELPKQDELQKTITEGLQDGEAQGLQGTQQLAHQVESRTPFVTGETRELAVSAKDNGGASVMEAHSPEKILDPELERAVLESLKSAGGKLRPDVPGDSVHEPSIEDLSSSDGKSTITTSPATPVPGDGPPTEQPIRTGEIIGQKTFKHDDEMLDAHLTSILSWWRGEREPRGVDVEESNRCHTCEYMEACEWREKKAFESLEKREK